MGGASSRKSGQVMGVTALFPAAGCGDTGAVLHLLPIPKPSRPQSAGATAGCWFILCALHLLIKGPLEPQG